MDAKKAGADSPKTLLNVAESTGDQSAAVAFIDIKINNVVKILAQKPEITTWFALFFP